MDYQKYINESNPLVTMKIKGLGEIKLELFNDVAPNTVANFVTLIEKGYYNKLIFHRVIRNFMIQGGWGADTECSIKGEFKSNGFNNELKHTRGVISMARTMVKDSATGQFFIMHQNSHHLDGEYAGFGGMIEGFDVLDAIASAQTDRSDQPLNDIQIESVSVDLRGTKIQEVQCV
ncbi:MAG: peptidylprolyl isomerase [Candidatus Izemoplasmataceae bacterium]|jgi:peptidyl-prolyl cis-trans isomerase B (cyclophilin B)|uniref:peptidylprolyl isomerase n=1 Tax=Liberiplasma polymorphum TaxID=3374570 RepID=UPI003771F044